MQFPGAQIANEAAAGGGFTPTQQSEAWRDQWGYRFFLTDPAGAQHTIGLETVGMNSVVNTTVIPPDIATTWDISTQNAMGNSGNDLGTLVNASTNTTFNIYWANSGPFAGGLGFSTSPPTLLLGQYVLGSAATPADFRFLGWMRVDSAGRMNDSITARNVINFYNRRLLTLNQKPGFVDNNASTTFSRSLNVWGRLNNGTNDSVDFISNGEGGLKFTMVVTIGSAIAGTFSSVGIGQNSTTTPSTSASFGPLAVTFSTATCDMVFNPGIAGFGLFRSIYMLCMTSNLAQTFLADQVRNGAATDPVATYLNGLVPG